MSHVKQAVALSDILGRVGVEIGDLRRPSVPQSSIDEFERHQPGVEILDFAHEIHYDDNHGASAVSMVAVVLETAWKITVLRAQFGAQFFAQFCTILDGAALRGRRPLHARRFTKLLRRSGGAHPLATGTRVPLIMD